MPLADLLVFRLRVSSNLVLVFESPKVLPPQTPNFLEDSNHT